MVKSVEVMPNKMFSSTVLAFVDVAIPEISCFLDKCTLVKISLQLYHNCFGPPLLFVDCLLSTGPTPSSFYHLVEMGLPIHIFTSYMCEN